MKRKQNVNVFEIEVIVLLNEESYSGSVSVTQYYTTKKAQCPQKYVDEVIAEANSLAEQKNGKVGETLVSRLLKNVRLGD